MGIERGQAVRLSQAGRSQSKSWKPAKISPMSPSQPSSAVALAMQLAIFEAEKRGELFVG
jgi:hypothetical protein